MDKLLQEVCFRYKQDQSFLLIDSDTLIEVMPIADNAFKSIIIKELNRRYLEEELLLSVTQRLVIIQTGLSAIGSDHIVSITTASNRTVAAEWLNDLNQLIGDLLEVQNND